MSNDKIVQTTIIGKIYKENKGKTYRLNHLLEEYFRLVKWYISIDLELKDISKYSLHEFTYDITRKIENINVQNVEWYIIEI